MIIPRTLPLFLLTICPALTHAGSVERVPATVEDLARELGVEIEKFTAKFDEPVYATVRLEWKQPEEANAKQLEQCTAAPLKEHTLVFTKRDLGQLQARTGGSGAKAAKGLVDMSVQFDGGSIVYRDWNPLRGMKAGQSARQWAKKQSFEPLPMDHNIGLSVICGPWEAGGETKDPNADYFKAPGYVRLTVRFTKEPTVPPAAPETKTAESAAEAKPAAPPAAAPAPAATPEPKKP